MGEEAPWIGAVFFAAGIILSPLAIITILAISTIAADEEGIAAFNFGRRLKFLPWSQVTKVVKLRTWNPARRAYTEKFHVMGAPTSAIDQRLINWRGSIVFEDDLTLLRELIDLINLQSQRFSIPLSASDEEEIMKNVKSVRAFFKARLDEKRIDRL